MREEIVRLGRPLKVASRRLPRLVHGPQVAGGGGVEQVDAGLARALVHVLDQLVQVLEVHGRVLEGEVLAHREHDVVGGLEVGAVDRDQILEVFKLEESAIAF